jgi:hypothetical protein
MDDYHYKISLTRFVGMLSSSTQAVSMETKQKIFLFWSVLRINHEVKWVEQRFKAYYQTYLELSTLFYLEGEGERKEKRNDDRKR